MRRGSFPLVSLMLLLLPLLSGCRPAYYVGHTLYDGKPAIIVPTCEDWKVEYFSADVYASGSSGPSEEWVVESIGGNTNLFVLGEVPEGYEEMRKQDSTDIFPLDAEYSVFYYQSSQVVGNDSAISNDSTFLFDFTDAEEGVIRMGSRVVTLEQLNATLESQCPS